jgi:hypothetical protein
MAPNRRLLQLFMFPIAAGLLLACGDGGSAAGRVDVAITDAPFPVTDGCLEAALVTVDGVEVRTEDGFTDVALVDPDPGGSATFDLLQLRAGLMDGLAVGELPTGSLHEIRLHIVDSVLVFSDMSPDTIFRVPSGGSSGLKIKVDPPVLILSGQTTELIVDVDLSSSFRTMGAGGDPTCEDLKDGEAKVSFRPVLHVNNLATDGVVRGNVMDADEMGVGDVEVCAYPLGTDIESDPEPTATTFSAPDGVDGVAEGDYALLLPAGTYDLYVRDQTEDAKILALTDVVSSEGERASGQDLVLP